MCKLLTQLLNVIFPPRETERLVQNTEIEEFRFLYSQNVFAGTYYLSDYTNEIIRSAIIENKFHNSRKSAKLLAELLVIWRKNQPGETLFIPIPLGKQRSKERGYNQIENILKYSPLNLRYDTDILTRCIETKPQTKLNKIEREKNVANAFNYKEPVYDLFLFSRIVILDDVVTTGTTLGSARETLQPHVPKETKIICLAISH